MNRNTYWKKKIKYKDMSKYLLSRNISIVELSISIAPKFDKEIPLLYIK